MTPSDHPDAKRQLEGEAMSMRERIAERMWKVSGLDRKVWDDPAINQMLHDYADAALDELRKPTEAMISAGLTAGRALADYTNPRDGMAVVWKAMIAEASK